ncbi:MAG: PKD domain-containing protein, partial [Bacteroidota bacterium]
GDVTSIVDPQSAATYVKPVIIDRTISPCNSAPIPPRVSQFYVCETTDTYLDMASIDPDGDSLVYRLDTCSGTVGNIPLNYNPGYSPTTPLGIFWDVSLDPHTGLMNVASTNTVSPEVAVVCVAIDEYRNGTYLATHHRDYQIRTISCSGARPVLTKNQVAGSAVFQGDTLGICGNSLLSLELEFADADTTDVLALDTILTPHTISNLQITGTNPLAVSFDMVLDSPFTSTSSSLNISVSDNTCPIVRTELFTWILQPQNICLIGDITDPDCGQNNGAISLNLVGLQGPFTYLWSTGDTSESIQNLMPGNYWVNVTDSSGALYTDTFLVESGDIVLAEDIIKPDCNTANGSISITATGGTLPYQYQWNTGDTTSSIDSLAPGGYSVVVTDDSSCFAQKTFVLVEKPICTYPVSGYAYVDLNGNCVFDSSDVPLVNQWIDFTPGGAVLTDSTGFYTYSVPPLTYQIELGPNPMIADSCTPNGITVNVSNAPVMNQNFGATPTGATDPAVFIASTGPTTTAANFEYQITVTNPLATPSSGTLKLVIDDSMQVIQTSPDSSAFLGDTIIWNYTQIPAFNQATFTVTFAPMPPSSLGDLLCITACISPDGSDSDTTNNVDVLKTTVLGAYDPNIKVPTPLGEGPLNLVPADELNHTYQIYFQNTGTFPALYVTIRDTISGPLVPQTLRPLGSSHPYTVLVEEDSILVFTFANINLPDSASDPTGSIGHIIYNIAHEPGLPAGTQVRNRAAIYFDFNPPIITPWAENTLYRDFDINFPDIAGFLCEGNILTADISPEGLAPFTYTWDTQQGNVDPDLTMDLTVGMDTAYSLIVTDALGVTSALEVTLPLAPNPDAQFSYSRDALDFEFSSVADDAFSYAWDFGDNIGTSINPNPSYTFPVNGSYIVQLIVTSPCGTDTVTQLVTALNVGIDGPLTRPQISPVPFEDILWVDLGENVQTPADVRLISLRGEVLQSVTQSQNHRISLST